MAGWNWREYFGLRRDIVVLMAAVVLTRAGDEMWSRFVPKYLEILGAGALLIGLYDGLKTALSAVYAYPGGVVADLWGHRRALVAFSLVTVVGYLIALIPHWLAVYLGTFFFLAWGNLSLPAMFSLVAATLPPEKLVMGIGVQSLVKRVPIIVGPIAGGWILDRLGFVNGVRIGLVVSIVVTLGSSVLLGRIESSTPSAGSVGGLLETAKGFHPRLKHLLISDILIRFCERIPMAWIVIYSMNHLGISATQFGLLTAVEMITAMLCYIPVAHLADRTRKEPFVLVTFLFFTLFPVSLAMATTFPMLVGAFVIRGLKEFGDPTRKVLILRYAPPEARGRTVGAYYMIRDLTVSGGAVLGGLAWMVDPAVNFWMAAAVGTAGTIYYAISQLRSMLSRSGKA